MSNIIIGGNGFIGKHIADELLSRGEDVIIFDNSPGVFSSIDSRVTFIEGDICDRYKLRDVLKEVKNIYHLAGLLGTEELFNEPQKALEVNLIGLVNLLEYIANKKHVKLFFPSTPYIWRNIYSLTKHSGEELCLIYNRAYGIDIRILRLWNIYGPYQQFYPIKKAVPLFIINALEGVPLEIYGEGNQEVQLVYVEDAAKVIVDFMALSGQFSNTLDMSGLISTKMTVTSLAESIIKACKSRSTLVHLPRRFGEFDELQPSRLQNVLDI
jgi:UDP-glucose 4-epimerase